jgi:hypothetical protein
VPSRAFRIGDAAGYLPRISVNKGIKKVRYERLWNTTNAYATKDKGHKVGTAS